MYPIFTEGVQTRSGHFRKPFKDIIDQKIGRNRQRLLVKILQHDNSTKWLPISDLLGPKTYGT